MKPSIQTLWVLGMAVLSAPLARAHGQTENSRRVPLPNVFSVNPIGVLLSGTLEAEYERAVEPWLSLFVGSQFHSGLRILRDVPSSTSAMGVGAVAGARYYFIGHAPEGLFLSSQFEAGFYVESRPREASGVAYGATGLFGGQWFLYDTLAISVGLGVRFVDVGIDGVSGSPSGSWWTARLSIGYACCGRGTGTLTRVGGALPVGEARECRFPVRSVRACESSRGYRFAVPYPQRCEEGSTPISTIELTCEAADRPAYHACLDATGSWYSVVSWETCNSYGWTDAPGDFVPPGRAPNAGVAPDPAAPSDVTLPPRGAVAAALAQLQSCAGVCLPRGDVVIQITFGNDGIARDAVAPPDTLTPEAMACFLTHARAVRLPTFTRAQLVVLRRFTGSADAPAVTNTPPVAPPPAPSSPTP